MPVVDIIFGVASVVAIAENPARSPEGVDRISVSGKLGATKF